MSRADIALLANACVEDSSRSHPILSADSPRETLCQWLQACDPNGTHLDIYQTGEEGAPYTLAGAWDAVEEMIETNS